MQLYNPVILEIIVVTTGFVVLLAEAFSPKVDRRTIAATALFGLALALIATFLVDPGAIQRSGGSLAQFYSADFLAIYFKQFSIVATMLTIILSLEYSSVLERGIPGSRPGAGVAEFLTIPIFACAGLMWMVSAVDFIMIFVSLELVTISFYVLVPYTRLKDRSLEAGVKYLILGALSTGFLVYGITWIFGVTQTTSLVAITELRSYLTTDARLPLLFGVGLVLVSIGFKVAAFPFQFWIPDVYQGAPTPVTAFLSVGSKAAGFVVLLRVLEPFLAIQGVGPKLIGLLVVTASATLLFGNLAALLQNNVKRLMAYSSVAHAGYLLVGVASVGAAVSGQAIGFYLTGYLLMTFLAFFVLVLVSKASGGEEIDKFNGLGKRSPFLAFAMMLAMVSLAGMPFTVGFFGKFLIFTAAVEEGQWLLVIFGAITVACGFYYYLKVVRAMYWQSAPDDAPAIEVPVYVRFTMVILMALIITLGIFPQSLLTLLSASK